MNEEKCKIEKNIEMPKRRGSGGKYPWDEMEVDDSFLVVLKGIKSTSAFSLVSRANVMRAPKHFAARKVSNGVRIWRTR